MQYFSKFKVLLLLLLLLLRYDKILSANRHGHCAIRHTNTQTLETVINICHCFFFHLQKAYPTLFNNAVKLPLHKMT